LHGWLTRFAGVAKEMFYDPKLAQSVTHWLRHVLAAQQRPREVLAVKAGNEKFQRA